MVEGALDAGVRFFAGYPITPGSEIMEAMAYGCRVWAGSSCRWRTRSLPSARASGRRWPGLAMTATSGPGFSLMQEAIGYAIMVEAPLRDRGRHAGGPSTGRPTGRRATCMQARWGTHGDHPAVVLAASTTRDCFEVTVKAFNLSERYRSPVIILSDEVVGHTRENAQAAAGVAAPGGGAGAPRHAAGVVPPLCRHGQRRAAHGLFGDGYRYHVTGLIHDVRVIPPSGPTRSSLF